MVKKFFFYLTVLLLITACKDNTEYTISGHISNADGHYLYLDELKVTRSETLDSVLLPKDGHFDFSGHVTYPTFFLLKLSEKNFITLLVDSAEQVKVSGDAANFSRDYLVEGSEGSLLVQKLNQHLSRTKHQLDSISSLHVLFRNDPDYVAKKKGWDEEYSRIRQAQVRYSSDFIKKRPFSMANVLALYQKFDDDSYVIQDLQSLKVAASALNSFYPQSEHVRALYANTVKLMREQQNQQMKKFIQEHGANSPEIDLPDPSGKKIALSSKEGKYVLLQFWSAKDRGSRIMNEALVEAYRKYHRKGFDIYQVSVDTNRYDWVNAIDQDRLLWTNVGDMEGSVDAAQAYNVQSLPANYLLDKKGNIVAKNVRGPVLNEILEKVLK